ncbi:Gbf1 protein [Tropilaelaps mercedesae]|uniref:Gbf1 protein n=1 Tax=Tropilaelaps mercedesae TaxID=418985 RepID=A0A1V9XTA8_9ACAR|nr:Gbf1 protein [Tropilaelaps mercedesae]
MGSLRRSTSSVLEPDRGYTSDSEVSTRTPKHYSHHNSGNQVHNSQQNSSRQFSTNITGSWILVGQEDGSPAKTGNSSVNQHTISLSGCELVPHDAFAMTKAAQCLTQLVRDSGEVVGAGVDERNVESCIRCIRVFVEASLQSKSKRPRAIKTSRGAAKVARSPSPTSESDSDGAEGSSAPPEYPHIAVQLLDVMHSLHTSCIELWTRCWCPLLQGMARLCCDTRKPVRAAALGYLQRALLVQDLQVLGADQWEACFHQVLFPLLQALLERQVFTEPAVADETRVRVNTLLSKVFLQHLSLLLTLPTFTALWLTVLDFMDKFMHLEQGGDLLLDAIPESLKNMLLVMNTGGVFRVTHPDGCSGPSELWQVTWDRVEPFLPGLQDELFKKPEPPLALVPDTDQPAAVTSNNAAPQNVEDMEGGLPPVVSLEEALAIKTPGRVPLSRMMGGILMQETTLTPTGNNVLTSSATADATQTQLQQQSQQQVYPHHQQQQATVYTRCPPPRNTRPLLSLTNKNNNLNKHSKQLLANRC